MRAAARSGAARAATRAQQLNCNPHGASKVAKWRPQVSIMLFSGLARRQSWATLRVQRGNSGENQTEKLNQSWLALGQNTPKQCVFALFNAAALAAQTIKVIRPSKTVGRICGQYTSTPWLVTSIDLFF